MQQRLGDDDVGRDAVLVADFDAFQEKRRVVGVERQRQEQQEQESSDHGHPAKASTVPLAPKC
jgi:hypothetical protein